MRLIQGSQTLAKILFLWLWNIQINPKISSFFPKSQKQKIENKCKFRNHENGKITPLEGEENKILRFSHSHVYEAAITSFHSFHFKDPLITKCLPFLLINIYCPREFGEKGMWGFHCERPPITFRGTLSDIIVLNLRKIRY